MIKHARITLRHVTEADLPILIRISGDPVARGKFNPSRIASPHAIQKRFNENGYSCDDLEMLLVCDESGTVIGDVLHFPGKRYATAREVGWTIRDPVNRIECCTATHNLASLRMAQKHDRYAG